MAGLSQGREEPRQERGWPAEPAGRSPGRGAGHRGALAGVSSAARRGLEAAGTARLCFGTHGMVTAPGNRSGRPSTNPVPVEVHQGCKYCKGNLKSSIHTPSTGTEEGKKMHLKVSGLFPERADPFLYPAMSQEAFCLGWVLIAATVPYQPEQVSLPCLSSPCFASSENSAGSAVDGSGQHQYF